MSPAPHQPSADRATSQARRESSVLVVEIGGCAVLLVGRFNPRDSQ